MEQVEKLAEQYAADESAGALKQLLRRLDEVQKQFAKELVPEIRARMQQVVPAGGVQLSTTSQGQLAAFERVREAAGAQNSHVVELLAILAQRLRVALTQEQKFAALGVVLASQDLCGLRRLALQALFKQQDADDARASQFVLLRYFTLASQQNNALYLLLLNWVVYAFLAQHNAYAALEFTNRNRAKTASFVRTASDADLATYYYQQAIVAGMAAQYERAVQLARQARIYAS